MLISSAREVYLVNSRIRDMAFYLLTTKSSSLSKVMLSKTYLKL